jgi:hypothetical protein
MTTFKQISLFLVLILFTNQIIAQEGSLQDLVGSKASSTEMDLQTRGYRLISNNKSDYASYTNWWSDDKNKCISVKTEDGRTASIIRKSPADCGQYGTTAYADYSNNDYNTHSTHHNADMHQASYEKGFNDGKYKRGYNNQYYNDYETEAYAQGWQKGDAEKVSGNASYNTGYTGYKTQVKYMDLKGWEAISAYDVLHNRGFREVERYKKDRLWIVWKHNSSGKCIKTGEDGGKIREVLESEKCN